MREYTTQLGVHNTTGSTQHNTKFNVGIMSFFSPVIVLCPGPVLNKVLHFCSDPYSVWRELSSKFYCTLNRLNHNTQGIINSNYSYLTLYLRRSRDMDEFDEYMRWLEGDDEAMDNIRNQTPTEPPAADDTPVLEGGDPAPRDGGEE